MSQLKDEGYGFYLGTITYWLDGTFDSHAWAYDPEDGISNNGHFTAYTASDSHLAMAVFDGVTVSTVPIPGAVWLLGSGLAGLIGLRRRQS